jgi:hypothetical protein
MCVQQNMEKGKEDREPSVLSATEAFMDSGFHSMCSK